MGGPIGRYPLVREGWSGDNLGDLLVGVKVNFLSEEVQKPMALAVRAAVKLPTGNKDAGVSTGQTDFLIDLVGSKNFRERVELAAYGGFAVRGDPDEASQSNGFRWGLGAGFPTSSALRLTAELNGEAPFDDTITMSPEFVATDGSRPPSVSTLQSFTAATVGVTWQTRKGFFLGGGLTWIVPDRGP